MDGSKCPQDGYSCGIKAERMCLCQISDPASEQQSRIKIFNLLWLVESPYKCLGNIPDSEENVIFLLLSKVLILMLYKSHSMFQ